jgi:6-pyruvoyltetrahydropterin/6-carboxytetrahydropterin synthase
MYILTVEDSFSSAHQLRGYKGKCENIHGHNWKIVVELSGEKLNDIGILIDFHEIKAILKNILSLLDHTNINDISPFDTINPSSENLSQYIYDELTLRLESTTEEVSAHSVTVWESDTSRCTYKK